MVTALTLALFVLVICVSEWVVRRLTWQLGGEAGLCEAQSRNVLRRVPVVSHQTETA